MRATYGGITNPEDIEDEENDEANSTETQGY